MRVKSLPRKLFNISSHFLLKSLGGSCIQSICFMEGFVFIVQLEVTKYILKIPIF